MKGIRQFGFKIFFKEIGSIDNSPEIVPGSLKNTIRSTFKLIWQLQFFILNTIIITYFAIKVGHNKEFKF